MLSLQTRLVQFRRGLAPAIVVSLLGLAATMACSSDSEGPESADDPLEESADFCAEYAKTVCTEDVADACSGTVDGCQTSQEEFCSARVSRSRYQRRAEVGGETFLAEDCLADAKAAYADEVITQEERAAVLQFSTGACAAIAGFAGDKAGEGDLCFATSECETGLTCLGTRCGKIVELGTGDSCGDDPAARCPDGDYCGTLNPGATDEDVICRRQQGRSGPCETSSWCDPGLVCESNVCTQESRGGLGDSCGASSPCESGLNCIDGTCGTPGSELDECAIDDDCARGLICSRVCLEELELNRLEEHCKTLRAP